MNQKTIQTVVEMLKVDGKVEDELLDDMVHDTAAEIATEIATNINNSGIEDQVGFLLNNHWSGEDILFKVREKREEDQGQ